MRLVVPVVCLVLVPPACSRTSSQSQPEAPSATAPTSIAPPPPNASASAAPPAAPPSSAPPASELPPLTYRRYGNPRFGFFVDVPTFFKDSPPPTNGDGQEWTWGARATMTASGMNASGMTTADLCKDDFANRKGATVKTITATTCWISGKDAGKIYWEKTLIAKDVVYTLVFAYDEHLKAAFDPLVTHVNASWSTPGSAAPPASSAPRSACTPGWIDECGSCFQPCNDDKDCKRKGQSCQPILCAHGSYGNGCTGP